MILYFELTQVQLICDAIVVNAHAYVLLKKSYLRRGLMAKRSRLLRLLRAQLDVIEYSGFTGALSTRSIPSYCSAEYRR